MMFASSMNAFEDDRSFEIPSSACSFAIRTTFRFLTNNRTARSRSTGCISCQFCIRLSVLPQTLAPTQAQSSTYIMRHAHTIRVDDHWAQIVQLDHISLSDVQRVDLSTLFFFLRRRRCLDHERCGVCS